MSAVSQLTNLNSLINWFWNVPGVVTQASDNQCWKWLGLWSPPPALYSRKLSWQQQVLRQKDKGLKSRTFRVPSNSSHSIDRNKSQDHKPVFPALERQRQKMFKFKAILGYVISSRPTWIYSKALIEIKNVHHDLGPTQPTDKETWLGGQLSW